MRTMALLAATMLAGGTVQAQATAEGRAQTREREVRRAEAEAKRGERVIRRKEVERPHGERVIRRVVVDDSARMNRATLGVTLGGAPSKRDTLGVFVAAVAEGGPAERAGIYEGYRIAYVNNVDVRSSAADAGDAYLSSVGRHRLMKALRDVSAGSTVTLRVWTGSAYRDVQVVAGRYADVYKHRRVGGLFLDGPGMVAPAMERFHIATPEVHFREVSPPPAPMPAMAPMPAPAAPLMRGVPAPGFAPLDGVPGSRVIRRYTI